MLQTQKNIYTLHTHTHWLSKHTRLRYLCRACDMRVCFLVLIRRFYRRNDFDISLRRRRNVKVIIDYRHPVGNIAEWKNSIVALSDLMGSLWLQLSAVFMIFVKVKKVKQLKIICDSISEQLLDLKGMIAGIGDSTDSKISDWNEENRRYLRRVFQMKRDSCQVCSIYLFDCQTPFQWKLDEFNVFHDPGKDIGSSHYNVIFGCFFIVRWVT